MNDLRDNSDDDGDMDDLMKSMGINLSLAPSSSSTTTLRTIADYALQKKIGEGARSEVYLVHHINISSSSNDECMCFAMKVSRVIALIPLLPCFILISLFD